MLTVRQLLADDIAGCVSLGLEAVRPVYLLMQQRYGKELFDRLHPNWEAAQAAEIEGLCASADAQGLVAVGNGALAGFIVVTSDEATGLAKLAIVAVRPAEQRSGIGTALIDQALDSMRGSRMAYVQAWLRDFPGHDPIRFALEKVGFESMHVQPLPMYVKLEGTLVPVRQPTNVRRFTESDAAECVRFGLEAFRPVYESFEKRHGKDLFARLWPDWENAESSDIELAITSGEKETWVYETDGEPCGFIVLTTDEQMLGDIELLAVNPDLQGRGIGTTLNQFGLDRLREAGMAYAIVATADDPGHAAARRAYEKVGFVPMPIQWGFLVAKL